LMDEPLKGLDIALKQNMIRSFSRIWKTDRRSVIFVTHDVDEAIMLGAEIMVMSRPPVSIMEHESINEFPENRQTESVQFRSLKQKLIKALG